ncbi:unnamed protein product [Mytilus coruscus]|uniref:Uncharacterized protein n=1 Tax=Mytilus coruscus TaxID=42192 RepID=A0A6J8EV71_MYTCO|nr:unnamed protein product [Mytilus coruscus]
MRLKLKVIERTFKLKMWHDHSDILNHSHVNFMTTILYDAANFMTDNEYQTLARTTSTTNVQSIVEKPQLYILGRSVSDMSAREMVREVASSGGQCFMHCQCKKGSSDAGHQEILNISLDAFAARQQGRDIKLSIDDKIIAIMFGEIGDPAGDESCSDEDYSKNPYQHSYVLSSLKQRYHLGVFASFFVQHIHSVYED